MEVVHQVVNSSTNIIRISRLTPAELTSAFAIKVRTGAIYREDAILFVHQLRTDIAIGRLEVFSISNRNLLSPSRSLHVMHSACAFVPSMRCNSP